MSPTSEALADSLSGPPGPPSPTTLTDSIDSLTEKLTVSPQTIPESSIVDHSLDQSVEAASSSSIHSQAAVDPAAILSLSRNSSTRSARRAMRIAYPTSRRSSRRSTSHTSLSPAQAFLSSSYNWDIGAEPPAESKPDDEGQAIGLNNEYIVGRTLNRGGFGVVKEVRTMNERTGREEVLAVKIVRKHVLGADDVANDQVQQDLEHEVSVWRHLKHPHVLGLHAVYETDYATFCVMDLNVGGTLFDLVRKRRQLASDHSGLRKGLDPALAIRYAHQLASALRYLHEDIRVCHRDVKLENCLIDTSGPDADTTGGTLRLCDFGLADFLHSSSIDASSSTTTFTPNQQSLSPTETSAKAPSHAKTAPSVIGTLEYASPRGLSVDRKLFETAGDVWAYGVVVYALCTGDLPFRHPMPSVTVDAILRADWDLAALRHASATGVGDEVCELVRGCLEKDIDVRWTIADCLRSPWFVGCGGGDEDGRDGGRDGRGGKWL